jgi:pilus assembly protein CpaF
MFGFGGGKDPSVQNGQASVSLLKRGPALRVISSDTTGQGPAQGAPLDDRILAELVEAVRASLAGRSLPRGEAARQASELVNQHLTQYGVKLAPLDLRNIVKLLLDEAARQAPTPQIAPTAPSQAQPAPALRPQRPAARPERNAKQAPSEPPRVKLMREQTDGQLFYSVNTQPEDGAAVDHRAVEMARDRLHPQVMDRIDLASTTRLPRPELERQLTDLVGDLLLENRLHLNQMEQRYLVSLLVDDMLGLGPLEPLLADETITDIMVNGPKQVYIERQGKLHITDVSFRDDEHVMNIAKRIVSRVGRRIDETTPLVDARLLDGSRVNAIIPPLAIDGPTISIRKFSKKKITLDRMVEQNNISVEMAKLLQIASRSRLNILISGGTGSGKTTLLNAMSRMIDHGERIVTIEDAAELQLQQPHVVRLETRPASIEGGGEILQRDLLKNALRMRPDRIILGEVRGGEALDMLQAMNTGHDGSMCTLHANRPREALTRLENMVNMAGMGMPAKAVRHQIASAINLIVQIARMRDGIRRVTNVMEIVGMEGDVITAQDLFVYEFEGEGPDGRLQGRFRSTGIRPSFLAKAAFYGLDKELMEIV